VLSPHSIQYLVRSVKARINKRLEAHFHMDFGMGVANTIMALAEGVEVVHSTVLELASGREHTDGRYRAGALTLYGIDTGLKHEKFYNLAKLVQQLSGHAVPATGRSSATRCSRSSPNHRQLVSELWRRKRHRAFPISLDVVGNRR